MQSSSSTPLTTVGIGGRSIRFACAAVLMLSVALLLNRRSQGRAPWPSASLSSMPMQIDGWSATDNTPDKQTLSLFGKVEFLLREYKNASQPQPRIDLLIEYFPTHAGDAMFDALRRRPTPMAWPSTSREVVEIVRPDGTSLPVNRYVVSTINSRTLVLYWFQVHGRTVASERWAKYYLLSDSIRMNRSDGALVRLNTPMLDGESADDAQARMMKFGSRLLPLLDSYISR